MFYRYLPSRGRKISIPAKIGQKLKKNFFIFFHRKLYWKIFFWNLIFLQVNTFDLSYQVLCSKKHLFWLKICPKNVFWSALRGSTCINKIQKKSFFGGEIKSYRKTQPEWKKWKSFIFRRVSRLKFLFFCFCGSQMLL